MSWFKEGREKETQEGKPKNQILQTSLKPESKDKGKLEANERKRGNEFKDSLKVPDNSEKEKLKVNKKADGNASGSNNDSAPDKGQRIRERGREER